MIKGNFNIKKVDTLEKSDEKKLEEFVVKSGALGSHMVFRSKDEDDELFVEDL